jgi:hypothetical protein
MGIRKNDCKGGMGEGAGHYQEDHWNWAASHTFCFSLALLPEVAIFALFQYFSIFQHKPWQAQKHGDFFEVVCSI